MSEPHDMTHDEHLNLATCIRLKAGGFSQNHTGMAWLKDPYQGWCRAYGTGREGRPFLVVNFTNAPVPATQYFHGEWIAEPPIIDALGTGGVLPWLRDKGIKVAYEEAFVHAPWSALLPTALTYIYSSTPEALVNAALDAMKEKP